MQKMCKKCSRADDISSWYFSFFLEPFLKTECIFWDYCYVPGVPCKQWQVHGSVQQSWAPYHGALPSSPPGDVPIFYCHAPRVLRMQEQWVILVPLYVTHILYHIWHDIRVFVSVYQYCTIITNVEPTWMNFSLKCLNMKTETAAPIRAITDSVYISRLTENYWLINYTVEELRGTLGGQGTSPLGHSPTVFTHRD